MAHSRKKDIPEPSPYKCAWHGCDKSGDFKAPVAPDRPGEYQWLCQEHITAFNKSWDYFRGKSQEEIEAFQKDAMTGHRPTWAAGQAKLNSQTLGDALGRFMHDGTRGVSEDMFARPINDKDKQALAVLDLEHPAERNDIKKQFKKLAKSCHPDLHPDDKKAEEQFKRITLAYQRLMEHYLEDS